MTLQEFYKGKKVFLTGHTGFKGSWLLLLLDKFGAKVTGYSLAPNTTPSMYDLIGGDNYCDSIIGDIRDSEKLISAMKKADPDIVIHMAAQPIVIESYKNPAYTYETNVMGTVNVLEGIRQLNNCRSFVNVTTDKVYENNDSGRDFVETDALGGFDPYSNSKACSELVTKAYRNSFFNVADYDKHRKTIITCRAGNVLGGGDFADNRIIPDCVRATIKGEKIVVRNPKSIRPWQHVLEPLVMYLTVAMLGYDDVKYSDHYNIGPDESQCKPVVEILEYFKKYWEGAEYEIKQNPNALHEAGILKLCTTKIKTELGYRPIYNVERTIETIAEWYKAYANNEDMAEMTKKQIGEFLQR